MLAGQGTKILRTLLADMTAYTNMHLEHEEQLMADSRYPDQTNHVRRHQVLRRRVAQFENRFAGGERTITIELTLFVSQWLAQHIKTSDRLLGEFLNRYH